jgi:F420-dependent oxidoreductase-like protein
MDLRIFVEPQQGASYADQLGVARAAEDGGFDAFFRSDHYLRIGAGDPNPGPTDAWVTLAGIARETFRIRLGTLMTSATFRYPGPLAIAVAQVDEMSAGRVELGIGAGWFEAEHAAHGIPFPPVGERFDQLTEQLEIITGLWGTPPGETYSYAGRHYQLSNSPALPRPAQRPRPPIIIGGVGPTRTPRLAARFADEFNVAFQTLPETARLFDQARSACVAAGREPASLRTTAALTVCCGRDDAELAQRATRIGQDLDQLRAKGVAGTPGEVVERLGTFRSAGADCVYLQVLDMGDLDQVDLLAAEVLPHL